jgi:hypothetical protein
VAWQNFLDWRETGRSNHFINTQASNDIDKLIGVDLLKVM